MASTLYAVAIAMPLLLLQLLLLLPPSHLMLLHMLLQGYGIGDHFRDGNCECSLAGQTGTY